MSDTRFELGLRAVLRDMAPAEVPASLRDAVAAVPRSHPVRSSRPSSFARPRLAVFAPLAAVIVLGVVGLVVLLGGFGGNVAAPSPTPSPTTSPVTSWTTLTYEGALPASTTPPTDFMRSALLVAEARLRSAQIPFTSEATASEFSVTVPTTLEMRAADLIGIRGALAFVPMGSDAVAEGDSIDLTAHPPMFGAEGIASAGPGTDAAGQRTVDLALAPAARTAFATYTSAHIGEYFAIVLDGKVLTAPVIQGAIPNGQVQVTSGVLGGFDTDAQANLIAILSSKAYPAPVRQVGSAAATPPANPWTPAPSGLQQTPATSATPMPSPSGTPGTLAVTADPGVPDRLESVTRWTGGYLGTTSDTSSVTRLWSSPDGRAWSSVLMTQYLDGIAPCGNRAVALSHVIDGPTISTSVSWTADGTTWQTNAPAPDPLVPVTVLAGGSFGAIAASGDGTILTTTDCTTWTAAKLPRLAGLRVTGVGVLGSRYIAVGATGQAGSMAALAWWSDNGTTWRPASVKAPAGRAFVSSPSVGHGGAIALVSDGLTPGISSHLVTTDGTAWRQSPSPLGIVTNGEGSGSDAGLVTSDGTHVLMFGAPGKDWSGPMQFWIGDGSGAWSQLRFSGSGADLRSLVSGASYPQLLADGLIVGGGSSALIATGPLP